MKKLFAVLILTAAMALFAAQAQAADTDGDGVIDANDNCQMVKNGNCAQNQLNCDVDLSGTASLQELAAGYQKDWDHDQIGDACEDSDGDGYMDYLDNCPGVANPSQNADACSDFDGDGVFDDADNCPELYNPQQEDRDLDGIGDWCDNCRSVANTDQLDTNNDGFGDACTEDEDGDGVPNKTDNCPLLFNPGQDDSDHDGQGDACETVAPSESPTPTKITPVPMNHGGCSLAAGAMAGIDSTYGISALILLTSGLALALRRKG